MEVDDRVTRRDGVNIRRRWLAAVSLATTAVIASGCGDDSEPAAEEDPRSCVVVPAEGAEEVVAEAISEDEPDEPVLERLEFEVPEGWCMIGSSPLPVTGGETAASLRVAGPAEPSSALYPTVEITGMWNKEQQVDLDALADGMEDSLEGSWSQWNDVATGSTIGRVRTNSDPGSRDEMQLIGALDGWVISVRSHDLPETELVDIVGDITATSD